MSLTIENYIRLLTKIYSIICQIEIFAQTTPLSGSGFLGFLEFDIKIHLLLDLFGFGSVLKTELFVRQVR